MLRSRSDRGDFVYAGSLNKPGARGRRSYGFCVSCLSVWQTLRPRVGSSDLTGETQMASWNPTEANIDVANGQEARVADDGEANILAEVFDDVLAAAKGLKVDTPVDLPSGGIDDWKWMFFGSIAESVAAWERWQMPMPRTAEEPLPLPARQSQPHPV